MRKKLLLSILIFSGGFVEAQSIQLSPEVYSTQGGNYVGTNLELSYTIGELAAISTISSGNLTLTQGFHQPDKFIIILIDPLDPFFGADLFPNPSSDFTQIRIASDDYYKLRLDLFDASGRMIKSDAIVHYPGEQTISLQTSELAAGTYLIRLISENGNVKKTLRLNKIYN
ncbi:MAG: T9SS type A sorting domain-containing protein [Bacteroidia bacterium]